MQITDEKLKRLLSDYYKMGYRKNFKDTMLNIMDIKKIVGSDVFKKNIDFILQDLLEKHNDNPLISQLTLDDMEFYE